MIEFRRLKAGDAAVLGRVAAEVFDEPIPPERAAAYLAEPGHIMLVALVDGVVVAQCAAVIHRHPDKVTELYVDEVGVGSDYRNLRIATRMLEEMFAIGKAEGCEEAWVGTEVDNVPARALYRARSPSEEQVFVQYVYEL
jgi:aminoglycoside 6'-N-acetyltransferase I